MTGSWTVVVDSLPADPMPGLPSGASEWRSPLPVARLTVRRAGGRSPGWQIWVHREDGTWPPSARLQICLADVGWGGTVESPYRCAQDAYLTVGSQEALLLWGSGNPTDIGVGLRLTGLSVDVVPGVYTAQVVYTIVPGTP